MSYVPVTIDQTIRSRLNVETSLEPHYPNSNPNHITILGANISQPQAIHSVTCRCRGTTWGNNRTNARPLPVLSQDAAVKMHARLMRSCTPTFSTRTLRSVSPGIPSYKTMYFATSFLTISSTASETWITIVERCRRASGPRDRQPQSRSAVLE